MAFKGDMEALILGVLQDRTAHGYEIAKRISQETDQLLKLGEGQLYPMLHRMEEQGMVAAEWVPQEGKPSRKVYRITEAGLAELASKRSAWEKVSSGISAILAGASVKPEGSRG